MGKKRFDGPAGKVVPIKQSRESSLDQRLNTPATIAECLQIAQAVVEDFTNGPFRNELTRLTDIIVSQTIHLETMKDLLQESGNWDDARFLESLKAHTDEYNKQRKEYIDNLKKSKEESNDADTEDRGSDQGVSGEAE